MLSPEHIYLRTANKYARAVSTGLITPVEYAENLLGQASLHEIDETIAREVASSVPQGEAQQALQLEISRVLAPGWQSPPVCIGGRVPDERELERIRSNYTHNMRRCAEYLALVFGEKRTNPPAQSPG